MKLIKPRKVSSEDEEVTPRVSRIKSKQCPALTADSDVDKGSNNPSDDEHLEHMPVFEPVRHI